MIEGPQVRFELLDLEDYELLILKGLNWLAE
jgi:hypothetical protein